MRLSHKELVTFGSPLESFKEDLQRNSLAEATDAVEGIEDIFEVLGGLLHKLRLKEFSLCLKGASIITDLNPSEPTVLGRPHFVAHALAWPKDGFSVHS